MIYLVVFLGGLFLTFLSIYPVRRLAHLVGAVAVPGGRSIHREPTPLMGGLAIYLACVVIGGVFVWWNASSPTPVEISTPKLLGLFLGATFLLLVGIIDDIKALAARWKLLGQLVAAMIPAFFGYSIQAVIFPFVGSVNLGPAGVVVFIFWVLAITNAVNLTDGLDGLASTVCFFAAVGNGIIALTLGNVFVAFFSFLLAGCLAGFLFHNFPPAKVFLGDTGSMLIGFLLAVTVIESNTHKRSTTILVIAPLLLLGFSLLDVVLSIIRRFIRGKPIFSSDLGHIHHRLMSRFRNPRRVLFVVAMFSMFMMVVSLVTHFHLFIPPVIYAGVLFFAGLITVMFVRLLGYFRIDRIRYVLDTREEIKFFTSLLGYLRYSLLRRNTHEELVAELDWVCRALKPRSLSILDRHSELVYGHSCPVSGKTKTGVFDDQINNEWIFIQWSSSTENEDPATCDFRLMWRELFDLFAQHWKRIALVEENSSGSFPTISSVSAFSEPSLTTPALHPDTSRFES